MKRKVLIITYYWPPAGGPGVQRWLKFVKYLPDFGIEPIVYCPKNPSYPIVDNSLVDDVDDSLTVLKQPIKEPYGIANFLFKNKAKTISSGVIPEKKRQGFTERIMLYLRGNFFIPDARKKWIQPSVNYLSEYLSNSEIDTVISTGPPHSLHLIGMELKSRLNLNWIADFRDPWTTIGYHKKLKLSRSSSAKHKLLEQKVLQSADHIIVTSATTRSEFSKKTEQPISVITNGYDISDINKPQKDEKFSLAHIGSLLSERNPLQLWEAISQLLNENPELRNSFQLKLIGVVSKEVIESLKTYDIFDYANNQGYVSHEEAIKAQMSSRVLLLIEIDSEDTKVIIPGKLFEYMASKTPILAIGPTDTDVENILNKTNTGRYFYYNQKKELKSHILSLFERYKFNQLEVNAIDLNQYSRKALTQKLAVLIKDL